MIQKLSNRLRRSIAALLYLIFYIPGMVPLNCLAGNSNSRTVYSEYSKSSLSHVDRRVADMKAIQHRAAVIKRPSFIGGPASPEASSFKAAGADNLVNLFTGDFSYSVPLLNVDGYPVNLFYSGGITMEQEASWVGLGWNINPGSVSRNMRGVPDDFNGTDTLIQIQNTKPNRTWGAEVGVDGELLGIKQPKLNFNVGYSYNNYLGPELELGAGVSVTIPITKTEVHEKSAPLDTTQGLNLSLGASAKLSSRSGLTLAPSLNAGLHSVSQKMDVGIGLSTSYNGRTGIKDLNIHSQMTAYRTMSSGKDYLPSYKGTLGTDISNTTISFARPSYMPTLRMPMQYNNFSGQLEFGGGMFGVRGAITGQGYSSVSKIADGSTTLTKYLVGYMYLEKATGRKDVVMDFNRVNDGEVTPHTPVISAPQYDYDVFTIQGEGTGGAIRAYRSDLGFMRDNETNSKDNNISIGFDIAPPGHYGGNWNVISAPTRSGNWDDASNTLNQTLQFGGARAGSSFENIYFRNPGEATVTNDSMINKMGRDNLVRFKIDGSTVSPRLETSLEQFNKKTGTQLTPIPLATANGSQPRDKRTQVVTMLTAADALKVGLDTTIRNYSSTLDASNNLQYTPIPRVGGYRKPHHISEISVLESSGMRYVYGLPVYNIQQKDFTFSVRGVGDPTTNLVSYAADEPTIGSNSITGNTGIDGYTNIQRTPAYASSFLITGLLSPDYVDRTGDGITDDDLGTAVKFDYSMSSGTHKWRTPRNNTTASTAHFNVGLKTEKRDNKATISYGEREAWYLHAIESKSMIAIFSTSPRQDSKGVNSDMDGRVASGENANLKLDSISLYTKSEIKTKGLAAARPIRTVHFEYSYALCNGTPDDPSGGKLTLTDVYFTYNGQSRSSKEMYVFNYGDVAHQTDNPNYAYNASDRWGTYKPVTDTSGAAVNPGGLNNIDYPYSSQNKAADDVFAGSWNLKKILLPSGGQIEVTYEVDDYAYVQNRRACNMYRLYGLGNSSSFTTGNSLYQGSQDNNYVYIQLPAALQNTDPVKAKQEIFSKYLDGLTQLAFKLNIYMPKGVEALTVYANWDDYGLCPNSSDRTVIYFKLSTISGKGPLANASVHFLIESLTGQAFPGYDLSDDTGIGAFIDMVTTALGSLTKAFTNAEGQVRGDNKGSLLSLSNSFIRLDAPTFFKYGGGYRVKRVVMKDNWNAMSGQYTSTYGQDYGYTTTTKVNGVTTPISSGVASYEPGIGSEENPFREILQFQDKLPLASAQYGAVEMPMLEGLFPSPVVGYSKVTVRSIHRNGTHSDSVVRSAVGRQVTEFYTAKDYPSYSTYTPMNNMDYHHNPPFTFFYKETIDRRTTSQGFLVETNDMHGKLKSQASYSEGDSTTPLSYTLHTYKNTGANGLNDLVDFVHNGQGGVVTSGNMGVDMELMTDVREFSVISNGTNGQAQVDFFTFVPWPIFGVFVYPLESYTENKYRAVTTTKLINYHAIEDSVIANDKGSTITTKVVAYDGETGTPVVSKTYNEFNDPVYSTNYPAYWAYSGMAPAYNNIGMQFTNVSISSGKISSGITDQSVLESGDELYVTSPGSGSPSCVPESPARVKLWVFDTNKNTTALTVPSASRNLIIMDSAGIPYTKSGMSFRIVRSGHRNLLSSTVTVATSMANPIQPSGGNRILSLTNAGNIVAASAVAFKEKWRTDNDQILKTTFTFVNCSYVETVNCGGSLQNHVNPYLKGLVGNYKPYRSYSFYGARADSSATVNTAVRRNGYFSGFSNYWSFNASNNLVPDTANARWIWSSEVTRINSRSQELEARDPLNVYTSTQYAYNKNLQTALTKNAMYNEAAYEGFEDSVYNENINKEVPNQCFMRHLDLTGLSNAWIVNTDTTAFNAHSGRYVLAVKNNSTASKAIAFNAQSQPDFSLLTGSTTSQVLNNLGGNWFISPNFPDTQYFSAPTASFGTSAFHMDVYPSNAHFHRYTSSFDFYINIPATGTYNFFMTLSTAYNNQGNVYTYSNGFDIGIKDLNNNSYALTIISDSHRDTSYSVYLCAGIYHITGDADETYASGTPSDSHNQYSWGCTNCNSPDYASLTTTNGCTSNTPIPGDPSMLNPVFGFPAGKKMVFSAWVREGNGVGANGLPDTTINYQNNQVVIYDGSQNITLKPSGTVIEGWQRYEGYFTPSVTGSSGNISFVNNGSKIIYLDDIRMHPFNADMKNYVYDPRTLRLSAMLDENNYTTFYDYDEEGQLIRVRRETIQGIKTIKETRAAKQKKLKTVQ